MQRNVFLSISLLILALCSVSRAADAPPKPLIDLSAAGADGRFKPTSGDVVVTRDDGGVMVTIQPGTESYPGIDMKADGSPWNLAGYGHIDAHLTNTGKKPITVAMRVDGDADWHDSPWDTEQTTIKPGTSGVVTVIFGYSYGYKPAYPVKAEAIANIKLFAMKSKEVQTYRIDSIQAAGPAGEAPKIDPATIRTKPKDGQLLATDNVLDAKGGQATAGTDGVHITFPAAGKDQYVKIKPPVGRWDLRDATQVRLKIKNAGQTAISPHVSIDSNGGSTDAITVDPIAAGGEAEVVVPFAAKTLWEGAQSAGNKNGQEGAGKAGTGSKFTSNAGSALSVAVAKADAEQSLIIESAIADSPVADLPAWLGQRPPVEGEWTKTFDEEFDGAKIDDSKWNIAGPNYWDKKSHWSKDNAILGDGVLKLRYEKKTGFQNDDPKAKQTDYAAGYLDTFGKFTQKYGYFESRMKLPTAPGLWPAFWMMPDRGPAAGEQWKRSATENGGMEFDVMEFLSGWGPHRYNIAMHWDGYGKNHKATGSEKNYVQADKDGYITCGLLWTPGSAIYYCQGKEVLRWDDPRIGNVPEYLMFTLPSGGWDNLPMDVKKLPDDFTIDYVRCWQRNDLVSK